ncbi:MAG: tetratricopeptide repeat protein [Raineya sp.]|jgi:tetratricopeptide (TPR) repeat protein|nr:tetratricopeptide repeat protein [Raineya sp.]
MKKWIILFCSTIISTLTFSQTLKEFREKGHTAFKSGNIDEAIQIYKKGVETFPKDATLYNNLGWMYYLKEDYKNAIIHLQKANNLEPNDAQTLKNIAEAYYVSNNSDSALVYASQALKINEKDGYGCFLKGKILMEQQKYELAITEFDKAATLNPDGAGIYEKRGYSKLMLEQYEEALKDFNILIKLEPEYHIAYNNRGYCTMMLKEYAKALPDFDKAIALRSDYSTAYNNKAYANFKMGKKEEACKDWQKASAMGNQDANNFVESYCKSMEMTIEGHRLSQGEKIIVSSSKTPVFKVSGIKAYSKIKLSVVLSKGVNLIVFKSNTTSTKSTYTTTDNKGKADINLSSLLDKKGNYQLHIEYTDSEGNTKEMDCIMKWK